MVVEIQKLHSNYHQKPNSFGMVNEGRINKTHPKSYLNSADNINNMHDMCIVKDSFHGKTIQLQKPNGLSFKGRRYDMLYKVARAIVDEGMPNRAWYLERKVRFDKVAEAAKKKHPILGKLITNKTFLKSIKFINDNALLSDAAIALFYTCCMRPLSIAALPAKDKNEKEKNVYQIGHSISTGLIGFATAFAIQTPIKDAFTKLAAAASSKKSQEFIKDSTKYLFKKENIEKTRTIIERCHQPLSLPLKAALTIYLVPKILKVFGLAKPQKVQNNKKEIKYDAFQYFASFKRKNNPAFQSFTGGLNYENK